MAAIRADHALLAVENGKRMFGGRDVERRIWSHSRSLFLDVEVGAAFTARAFPMFDGDRLHRHHRTRHDGRAVTAACDLTWPVLPPECINQLWTVVFVILALPLGNGEGIKGGRHH